MRIVTCFLLPIAATLWAQPAQPQSFTTAIGIARDYIVLAQPPQDHELVLRMRPVTPAATEAGAAWERWDPDGEGYDAARRIEWMGAATCSSGLGAIYLSGPGGTLEQAFNGSDEATTGRTLYDSFDADALDRVCIGWAERAEEVCGANPLETPGCRREATFTFGPRNPLPHSASLAVSGRCMSGVLARRSYVPRLRVTCRLEE